MKAKFTIKRELTQNGSPVFLLEPDSAGFAYRTPQEALDHWFQPEEIDNAILALSTGEASEVVFAVEIEVEVKP